MNAFILLTALLFVAYETSIVSFIFKFVLSLSFVSISGILIDSYLAVMHLAIFIIRLNNIIVN